MTTPARTTETAPNADASREVAPLAQRRPGRAHALAGIGSLLDWFDRNPVPTPQSMTVSHHISAGDEPSVSRRRAALDDVATAHGVEVLESVDHWHVYLELATLRVQGIEIQYALHADRHDTERPL